MRRSNQSRSRPPLLQMEDASLDFGGQAGVFDLTFSLKPGIILGLIGPSGCGKTTTIRLLTGIFRPTGGEVRVFGKPPASFADTDKKRIGYIPQQFILYPYLSVEENLHFMGGLYGIPAAARWPRIERLLAFTELVEARRRLAWKISGGMQRRLMLAGALLHDPELIFADEPTAGIDPILRAKIWENFRQLRDEGRTVLVATQYVGEAAYCDQVAVMRQGRLVAVDTPEKLRRKAMGGEIIRLQVDSKDLLKTVEFLASLRMVKSVERVDSQRGGLSVLVKQAGKTFPVLLAALKENLGITPKHAEPYLPPFDEVFIRIIQRAEAGIMAKTRRKKPPAGKQAVRPTVLVREADQKTTSPEAGKSERVAADRIVEDAVVKDPGIEEEAAKFTVQVAGEQKEEAAAAKEGEASLDEEEAGRRQ